MIGDAYQQAKKQIEPVAFKPVSVTYSIYTILKASYALSAGRHSLNYNSLISQKYQAKEHQQWRFIPDDAGNYTIRNMGSNVGVIHIPDFFHAKGGTICKISYPVEGLFQKWRMFPAEGPS